MSQQDYFEYLTKLRDHLELVAHIPVRNVSIAVLFIQSNKKLFIIEICEIISTTFNIMNGISKNYYYDDDDNNDSSEYMYIALTDIKIYSNYTPMKRTKYTPYLKQVNRDSPGAS